MSSNVSRQSLKDARKHLNRLEDAYIEDEGYAPPWITAARVAVQEELEERESHDWILSRM